MASRTPSLITTRPIAKGGVSRVKPPERFSGEGD